MSIANCDAPSAKSAPTARAWLRLEMPRRRGTSPVKNGSIVGIRQGRQNERRPYRGGGRRKRPSRDQCKISGRRRQGAAQVIDHFPAADHWNAFGDASGNALGARARAGRAGCAMTAAENPG